MSASYYIKLYSKDVCKPSEVFPLLVIQNPKDNIMMGRKVPNMQEDYITWESKHPDYHNYVIPEDWHRPYSRQNILVFLNCDCRRPDLLVNGLDDSKLMGIFHFSLCSIDNDLVLLRTQFQCRSNFPEENTILADEKNLSFFFLFFLSRVVIDISVGRPWTCETTLS